MSWFREVEVARNVVGGPACDADGVDCVEEVLCIATFEVVDVLISTAMW